MFAIIATGGKQINVEVGKEYFVEKLIGNDNDKVIFDKVLMIDGTVGQPLIENAQVHAVIIKQDKAKKVIVFKYKPKKNSKTKYGHRQPYTKVKITDIFLNVKDVKLKDSDLKAKETLTETNKETKEIISIEKKTKVSNSKSKEKVTETTSKKVDYDKS